jgi:flagellar protein FliJ
MKFKFPFQNVLNYRKTLENLAQTEFSKGMAELNSAMQALSDMEEEKILARENAFEKQLEGGKAGPALSQVHEFLKGQDIRMARQRIKIQECEKRVEELREILRQKALEYKIIERLRDNKKEEFAIEQRKLEQKKVDDLNIMRFKPEGSKK